MAAWRSEKTVWSFECASCRADKSSRYRHLPEGLQSRTASFARRNAEHGTVRLDARQSMRPDSRAGRREYLATAAAALGHWGRSQPLKAQRLFSVIDVERCQKECGAGDEFDMAAQLQEWLGHVRWMLRWLISERR